MDGSDPHQSMKSKDNAMLGGTTSQDVNVELTNLEAEKEKTKKEEELRNRDRANTVISFLDIKLSYRSHVGWDGTFILLLLLLLSGLSGYLVYVYSVHFANPLREGVWVYIVLTIAYFISTIFLLVKWKSVASDYTRRALAIHNPHSSNSIWLIYRETFINGKYYLLKLYLIELFESFNQLNNVIYVYLCSLPVESTSVLCLVLVIDSWVRAYEVLQRNTPERRDRQIKIDIVMDLLCMIVPLCIMKFRFQVPISIGDLILITLFPALCLFSKLRSIFREIVRLKSFNVVRHYQSSRASQIRRNRKSIYSVLETTKVAREQHNAVPIIVRKGFAGYNILYGIFMSIVVIIQLVSFQPDNNENLCDDKELRKYCEVNGTIACKPLLWKSCEVKTPFCTTVFVPKCNCAVLNVRKHNWTKFPSAINEMTALKIMQINHGRLQHIPNNINDKFDKLTQLDLSYNNISNVPESLSTMNLVTLKLTNNNIRSLPSVVWGNKYMFDLYLDNNDISKISSQIKDATDLRNLYLRNNSLIEIPDELFELNFGSLYLDGNRLQTISGKIGNLESVLYLSFNNNKNISTVPGEIGNLKLLQELDLRNNAIATLPDSIKKLKQLGYTYLHGNPICTSGWLDKEKEIKEIVEKSPEAGCKKQCSKYCQDSWRDRNTGIKTCVSGCNSKECDYQNGVCSA